MTPRKVPVHPEKAVPDGPEPRIVSGTGVATAASVTGNTALAERLEEAMTLAIKQAYADGITDDEGVKQRVFAARDKILDES